MGRRIPPPTDPSFHSALTLLPLIAWIAAIIAVISALCGTRTKKSSKQQQSAEKSSENTDISRPTSETALEKQTEETQSQEKESDHSEANEVPLYPLPLPQSRIVVDPIKKSASTRQVRSSFTLKGPSSFSMSRVRTTKERRGKKADDCVWKKTIILGERCRVPGEEEEEENIYDEKGNKIVAYAPRTPRSGPLSRSSSVVQRDSISPSIS